MHVGGCRVDTDQFRRGRENIATSHMPCTMFNVWSIAIPLMLYGVFLQSSSPDLIVAVFLLAAAIVVAAVIIGVRMGKAKPAPAPVSATVDMDSFNRMIESLVPSVEKKIIEDLTGAMRKNEGEMNQKFDERLNTAMSNMTDDARQMVDKLVTDAGQSVRDEAMTFLNKNSVKREEFERLAERVESELGADELAERFGILSKIFDSVQIKTLNWQCGLIRLLRGGLAPGAEEDTMVAAGIPKSAYGKFLKRLISEGVISEKNIPAFYMEPEFEWIYGYVDNPDFLRSRLANQERIKGLEKDYHEYIKKNPQLIEKGLRVQESQYRLDTGPIDLLCRDLEDRPVGVELKYPSATTAVVRQIGGYKTDFKRKTNVGNARFMVVSPSIPKKVENLLDDYDVECREVAFDDTPQREEPPKKAQSETVGSEKTFPKTSGILPKAAKSKAAGSGKKIPKPSGSLPTPARRWILNASGSASQEEGRPRSAI